MALFKWMTKMRNLLSFLKKPLTVLVALHNWHWVHLFSALPLSPAVSWKCGNSVGWVDTFLFRRVSKWGVMDEACDPGSKEAEAGASPQDWGYLGSDSEFPVSLGYRVTPCLNKHTNKLEPNSTWVMGHSYDTWLMNYFQTAYDILFNTHVYLMSV